MKFKYIKINFWLVAIFLSFIVFVFGFLFLNQETIIFPEFKVPDRQISENKSEPEFKEGLLLNVPFVVQAPFANWDNPVFQDACEEAAIIMAMGWVEGKSIAKEEAQKEIIAISEFEQKTYGEYRDRSATDTVQLMKDYFGYQNIEAKFNITIEDIKSELKKGNLVITPMDGQKLGNPFYTLPGPERHMLVIIGYDSRAREFITNDSGTKRGKGYRYNENVLYEAIRDYETGYHIPIAEIRKAIIVIGGLTEF